MAGFGEGGVDAGLADPFILELWTFEEGLARVLVFNRHNELSSGKIIRR